MSARPFEIQTTFARLWIDSSLQMMRATTDLWTSLLDKAPARAASSTASPWWMPPQTSRSPLSAGMWPAYWPQATMLPSIPAPASEAIFSWLPRMQTAAGNPFAMWQQMWLQAAAPQAQWPWRPAQAATTPDVWQPVATAYRTANGHAMAAVLRTMADVVEPKPRALMPADFWPMSLGTRH